MVTAIALQDVARRQLNAARNAGKIVGRRHCRSRTLVGGGAAHDGTGHAATGTVGEGRIAKGPAHVSAGREFLDIARWRQRWGRRHGRAVDRNWHGGKVPVGLRQTRIAGHWHMRRDGKRRRSSGGERRSEGRRGGILLRGWRIQAGRQVVVPRGRAETRRYGGRGGYGHGDRSRRSRDRWRGSAHGSRISRASRRVLRVGRHESPGEPGGSSPGRWGTMAAAIGRPERE